MASSETRDPVPLSVELHCFSAHARASCIHISLSFSLSHKGQEHSWAVIVYRWAYACEHGWWSWPGMSNCYCSLPACLCARELEAINQSHSCGR
uniref:Uncharacterized protein n=1 Tax=Arundo donax TaxID=35708 RepID=A0A0A8XPH0_ARUDO